MKNIDGREGQVKRTVRFTQKSLYKLGQRSDKPGKKVGLIFSHDRSNPGQNIKQ